MVCIIIVSANRYAREAVIGIGSKHEASFKQGGKMDHPPYVCILR